MPVRPIPLPRPGLLPVQNRLPTPAITARQDTWLEDSVPTRALLEAQPANYLVRGSAAGADLRLLKVQDTEWVVKDFASRPAWLRQTLGAWLIAREFAALKKLEGLEGVPGSVVRVDRFAFAYRHVEGLPLSCALMEKLPADFFQHLEALVEEVHRRGVVHLNLGQGSNILVTPEQRPVILDFQTHVRLPLWIRGLRRLLARIDGNAIHQLWNRYMLALLSAELKPARRIRT
ncbi:MAG: hypothetical protein K0S16_578 [Moraxellaceae bacterium]|jgi:hypothetical protein|nr:hypothetical protein [Moraxellaceae bacterium]